MGWNYDPYTGEPLQEKWSFDPYTGEKIDEASEPVASEPETPAQNLPEPPVVRTETYSSYTSSSNTTGIVSNIILAVITLLLILIVGLMGAAALAKFMGAVTSAHESQHSTHPSYSITVPEDEPQVEIGDGDHVWVVPDSSKGSDGDTIKPSEPSGSKGDSYDPRDHSNVEFR